MPDKKQAPDIAFYDSGALKPGNDYAGTLAERAVLRKVARLIAKYEIEFDTVAAVTNIEARQLTPFLANTMEGKRVLFASPEAAATILRSNEHGLEGILRHENAHVIDGNLSALLNLGAAVDLLKSLTSTAAIASEPETQNKIKEQFGSIENFQGELDAFQKSLSSVTTSIMNNASFANASPAALALLLEANDSQWVHLREELEKLNRAKLIKLAKKTSACTGTPVENVLPSASSTSELSKQLKGLGNTHAVFKEFYSSCRQAEEYNADGRAVRDSADPLRAIQSIENIIKLTNDAYLATLDSKVDKDLLRGKLFLTDQEYAPAPLKRIARMVYIMSHEGKSPDAAELENMTTQLFETMRRQAQEVGRE